MEFEELGTNIPEEKKELIKSLILECFAHSNTIEEEKTKLEDLKKAEETHVSAIQALEGKLESCKQLLLSELETYSIPALSLLNNEGERVGTEVFARSTNVFDDVNIIKLLRETGLHPECIQVKETIKKRDFNKVLKTDTALAEKLEHDGLIGTNITKYVVVTTSANLIKMHEHMETKE